MTLILFQIIPSERPNAIPSNEARSGDILCTAQENSLHGAGNFLAPSSLRGYSYCAVAELPLAN